MTAPFTSEDVFGRFSQLEKAIVAAGLPESQAQILSILGIGFLLLEATVKDKVAKECLLQFLTTLGAAVHFLKGIPEEDYFRSLKNTLLLTVSVNRDWAQKIDVPSTVH